MTKVYLVRHGLTEYNKILRLQGSSDIPLNEEGLCEAGFASDFLQDYHFDIILSSPLERAYTTAEIINEHHHLPIETMDELKEQSFGPLEGEHIENIRLRYPEGDLPGAETFEELNQRIKRVITYIDSHYDGGSVLVTAHSRTIKSILSLYSDEIHMVFTKLDNCSLSVLMKGQGNYELTDVNIPTRV